MSEKEIITKDFICAQGRKRKVSYAQLRGSNPGPTLTLIAGQHGMEHMGPVTLKEMTRELEMREFRGVVNICPCANPFALELDYEFYPENEDLSKLDDHYYSIFRHDYCIFDMGRSQIQNYYNMNRLWNREEIHGVAGEITHWLWNEIVKDANVTIDFHALQAEKPLIYNWHEKSKALAANFGIQTIYPCVAADDFNQGNLCFQAGNGESHAFCVEFSKQHGYKNEFETGKQGILNMMKAIGMIDGRVRLENPVYGIVECVGIKAETLGHIHYLKNEYDPVFQGEALFEITSLENFEILQRGISPIDGIYGRRGKNPIAKPGEMLVQVLDVEMLAEAQVYLSPFKV